jgi:hypothetical protein
MLESVVEYEQIPQFFVFRQSPGFKSISANDDRDSRSSPRNQEWFITGFLPRDYRSIAATDNQDSITGAFVSSRQNYRTVSFTSKSFRQRNNQRRFAGPPQREVADTNDRMVQTHGSKQSGLIHFFSRTEQDSEYAAHGLLLRGNAAALILYGEDYNHPSGLRLFESVYPFEARFRNALLSQGSYFKLNQYRLKRIAVRDDRP